MSGRIIPGSWSHHRQFQTACHRNLEPLDHGVTEGCVERLASQCRHDVNGAKARFDHCSLTGRHDAAPNAAARPCRMDEAGSNPRWIAARVKIRDMRTAGSTEPLGKAA